MAKDMSALMEALKRSAGPAVETPDDSVDVAAPEAQGSEMDSKIVALLKQEYPDIYSKLVAEVGDGDESGEAEMPELDLG